MKDTLRSNSVLVGFYILYLVILAVIFMGSFVYILIIHGILILVALTPIGESVMRLLNHTKKIQTQADKDYLFPLFEEVYEDAKNHNPKLSNNIILFMNEDIEPNAFACASNTVCVTRGAINAFTREELQGVLAHELGHISNNDTKVSLVFLMSNLFIMALFAILNFIFWIASIIVGVLEGKDHIVIRIVKGLKNIIGQLGSMLVGAIFSLNSRNCERGADKFAFLIGYGLQLKEALGILSKFGSKQNMSLMDRIYASHPDLDTRIAFLENLEQLE